MRILAAGWVVTGEGAPLREGRVAVAGGRIVWVGTAVDPGQPEGTLEHLGPGVLLPGLVNAHSHLELSALRGLRADTAGFVPWVEAVLARRAETAEAEQRRAVECALSEMADSATVAVGDVSGSLAHVELLEASGLDAVVFHELLGWDPARAGDVLRAAVEREVRTARSATGRVRIRRAAHAPYSVSPALFSALVAEGGPAAVHLAESAEECRFVARGDGPWRDFFVRRNLGHVAMEASGQSPVQYLDGLGALRSDGLAVHCVHVNGEDARVLARRGMSVALCPRSNARIGVGTPPVRLLMEAGVRLCLGTDSLASVDSLDIADEMAALHRTVPAIPAAAVVRMATRGGAEALGFRDLGLLAPGCRAALAYAPCEGGLSDAAGFLVSGDAHMRRV